MPDLSRRDRVFYATNFMIPLLRIFAVNLLLCFLVQSGFAQIHVNLSGIIRDADTGETLAQAHIAVMGTGTSTLSDADGRFEIRGLAAGFYDVQVHHIGYEIFVIAKTIFL